MNEWNEGIPHGLEEGAKIEAVIRHFNKDLNLEDETVILVLGCDNFYIDGVDGLSYFWDIVKWRRV